MNYDKKRIIKIEYVDDGTIYLRPCEKIDNCLNGEKLFYKYSLSADDFLDDTNDFWVDWEFDDYFWSLTDADGNQEFGSLLSFRETFEYLLSVGENLEDIQNLTEIEKEIPGWEKAFNELWDEYKN